MKPDKFHWQCWRVARFVTKGVRNGIAKAQHAANPKAKSGTDKKKEGWVFWLYYIQIVGDVVSSVAEYGFFPKPNIPATLENKFKDFSLLCKHCLDSSMTKTDEKAVTKFKEMMDMMNLSTFGSLADKGIDFTIVSKMLGQTATLARDGQTPNPSMYDLLMTCYAVYVVDRMRYDRTKDDPCERHLVEYKGNISGSKSTYRNEFNYGILGVKATEIKDGELPHLTKFEWRDGRDLIENWIDVLTGGKRRPTLDKRASETLKGEREKDTAELIALFGDDDDPWTSDIRYDPSYVGR